MPVNGSAQGGNYSFVNIDYPGAYQTIPEAINNNGAIVGYYLAMQFGPTHGFLYSGGVYTTIDDPEGTTFPEGINDNGVISGLIEVGATETHGFTYENGVFTSFDYPGYSGLTSGEGINNNNEIVGIYSPGGEDGFLDNNGNFSPLRYPGADDTYPHAINNNGHVAGFYSQSTVPFGFVYDGSTFATINYSSGFATYAYGINDLGVVVGYSQLNDYPYQVAFLWQAGQFTAINSNEYVQPYGINNNGLIVGNYDPDGNLHGFLATPVSSPPLQFYPVLPCRVVDTRNTNGMFGGPPIQGGTSRSFPLPQQTPCDVPSTAAAYSLNVTVIPGGELGFLTIWPTGQPQPVVSTMNSLDGRVKANAAIVPAGTNEAVSVYVSNTTNVVLDIDGYFAPSGGFSLEFYPLTPCRVVDTRNANGDLGGPYLQGGQQRNFPVLESTCGIPNTAQAYSLNFTAIPKHGSLGYLTVWPEGLPKPLVSTLNDPTGTIVANAAIVPAGTGSGITVYPSDDTNLAIDVNGYFAPAGTRGLSLYVVTPCRVLDTRHAGGAFTGKLVVDVLHSVCAPPATAQSYVFNATVLPQGPLGYLSLWADGQPQPVVSTLNAADGAFTSNMAIVPASTQGKIDAFAANGITQLLMDISSYFAP